MLTPLVAIVVLALAVAGAAYGYARFRYDQIHKVDVAGEVPAASGKPFNMLVIGSDSRVGNVQGTAHFGTSTKVGGQRSDVDMIWHVAPATKRITILSIPRDTLVSMVGKNISTFGRLNRINASYNSGPSLLVQTIEANFGIPISHVVQVDFGGLVGAVNALGGIHMDFPYPTRTVNPTTGVNESGLDVTTPGCQLLTGTKALAVARSRDYQYQANGTWQYTPAGDLGRIKRQDAFMKALIDEAKTKYNPLTLNALLGSIPQGVAIDSSFSMDGLIGLAESFHSIDATTISTMTLPTMSRGYVTPWGDVLFVDQPAAQQLLVSVFGGELTHPTSPPPNTTLEPATPPAVTASAPASGHSAAPPAPPPPAASFDPTPCRPS
ncbi:MAG: LCP family protein [Acidimicrobiales bacterium]